MTTTTAVWALSALANAGVYYERGATMKLLLSTLVLALSACATVTPPPQHASAGMSRAPLTPGTVTITSDELQRTGRTELSDALRAASPLFH
jgi:hypothetical protein